MAAVEVYSLVPSENWDEDFEFNNPYAHARMNTNRTNTIMEPTTSGNTHIITNTISTSRTNEMNDRNRMSIATAVSDWDHDFDFESTNTPAVPSNMHLQHTSNINVSNLEDKKNTIHLGDWSETQPQPGPSTPRRDRTHVPALGESEDTENWDSDFEVDSPPRPNSGAKESESASSSPLKKGKASPSPGRLKRKPVPKPRPESWDEEFEAEALALAQTQARMRESYTNKRLQKSPLRPSSSSSEDEGDGEPDDELGFTSREDEEDRTVTARPRRGLRLSDAPPVPSLPLPFLLPSASADASSPISSTFPSPSIPSTQLPTSTSPFPRSPTSPTSSVFSVPTTLRPPSSFTVTSTTPLNANYIGRTTSRSSSGLGALPPSPPIHRERERRRLRKKSRPGQAGAVMELAVLQHADFQGNDYDTAQEDADDFNADYHRPFTPPPLEAQDSRHGTVHSTPATPSSAAGTILSRIGSVKKRLGAVGRRRGASTGPGEVVRHEPEQRSPSDVYPHPHLMPRPHSQASTTSSNLSSSSAARPQINNRPVSESPIPPPNTNTGGKRASAIGSAANWFFRSTSSSSYSTNGTSQSNNIKASTSDLDLPSHFKKPPQTPTKEKGGMVLSGPGESPAKLVKRKSLGFVQLRRGMAVASPDDDKEREKALNDGDDVVLYERRGIHQDKEAADGNQANSEVKEEKEGARTFMGSVRRISLVGSTMSGVVGRHKRAKSVTSNTPGSTPGAATTLNTTETPSRKDSATPVHAPAFSPITASRLGLGAGLRDDTITPTPESVAAARSLAGRAAAENAETTSSSWLASPSKTPTQTPRKSSDTKVPTTPTSGKASRLLLPPIELQPPSPPRTQLISKRPEISDGAAGNALAQAENMLSPASSLSTVVSASSSSSGLPLSSSASPLRSASINGSPRRSPGATQAASLGRSTIIAPELSGGIRGLRELREGKNGKGEGQLRRSSLGDLKIPERISQAQVGLRRDMERVKEFAAGIEQLKDLQETYDSLATQIQGFLDQQVQLHQQEQQQHALLHHQQTQQASRPTTPSSFFAALPRPISRNRSRSRSNTNPPPPSASTTSLTRTLLLPTSPQSAPVQASEALTPAQPASPQQAYKRLASAYYSIRSKYRISRECAELLVELGSGTSQERVPSTSVSAPIVPSLERDDSSQSRKKGRERAITLTGGEDSGPKPGTPVPGSAPGVNPSSGAAGLPMSASETRLPSSGKDVSWRSSSARGDLSQRQLTLLREILQGHNEALEGDTIPEENINREWRWGHSVGGMASTVTLPSGEEDSSAASGAVSAGGAKQPGKLVKKRRRQSRLRMAGLRDMLRSLTKHQAQPIVAPEGANIVQASTTSLSTTDESSMDSHRYPHAHLPPPRPVAPQNRRRAKTSSGPEAEPPSTLFGGTLMSYKPPSLSGGKPSPRRPSLASIFRLGHKSKATASSELPVSPKEHNILKKKSGSRRGRNRTSGDVGGEEEEDWDRMDDADESQIDSEGAVTSPLSQDGVATVRFNASSKRGGLQHRSPYLQDAYNPSMPSLSVSGRQITPKRSASGSQSSIWGAGEQHPHHARTTRLSNVEEYAQSQVDGEIHPPKASSRGSYYRSMLTPVPMKTGSVRSMPPQPVSAGGGVDPAILAMTPENIRPLLENSKEVREKLSRCNEEMRKLLEEISVV